MISRKRSPLFSLGIIILPFIMLAYQATYGPIDLQEQKVDIKVDTIESDLQSMSEKDPVMDFLGKSFAEIKEELGQPDEKGYSTRNGPHNYMLFKQEDGPIIFNSPIDVEKDIAVSIFLGEGQSVLGAKVGMTFTEIKDILGTPDFGPEPGMDHLYHMEYFIGETTNHVPEIFISFSTNNVNNSQTQEAFIKWEAFEYKQKEIF